MEDKSAPSWPRATEMAEKITEEARERSSEPQETSPVRRNGIRKGCSPARVRSHSCSRESHKVNDGDVSDASALKTWLMHDAFIYEDEMQGVMAALANKGIATLSGLRKYRLVNDLRDTQLTPLQRMRIEWRLSHEAQKRMAAARVARAWVSAAIAFFALLLVLFGLLAYRKLGDALEECCGLPRIYVLQRLAGWLWTSEYASPTFALVLILWWATLLVGLWRTVSSKPSDSCNEPRAAVSSRRLHDSCCLCPGPQLVA